MSKKFNCQASLVALCKGLQNKGTTNEYINEEFSLAFCKFYFQFKILIKLYLSTSSLFALLIFLPFLSILTVLLMCFLLSLPNSFSFHTFFLFLHLSFFLSISSFPSRVLLIIFLANILIAFSPYLFYSYIFVIPSNSFSFYLLLF